MPGFFKAKELKTALDKAQNKVSFYVLFVVFNSLAIILFIELLHFIMGPPFWNSTENQKGWEYEELRTMQSWI